MNTFDPSRPSKGLGDSIAKVTHALGIDKFAGKVAEAMGEEDCGCERRREMLNNLVSYDDVPEEEYLFTDSRLFKILVDLSVDSAGETVIYRPDDIVLIRPGHVLYPGLRLLIKQKYLTKHTIQ